VHLKRGDDGVDSPCLRRTDEPVLGLICTADLLPKGRTEVKQWMTWRHQKAGGYCDQLENRTVGLTLSQSIVACGSSPRSTTAIGE